MRKETSRYNEIVREVEAKFFGDREVRKVKYCYLGTQTLRELKAGDLCRLHYANSRIITIFGLEIIEVFRDEYIGVGY